MASSRLERLIRSYDPALPLERAWTLSGSWYTDPGVHDLERAWVFHRTWQCVARLDQLAAPGSYVTADVAGEPIVVTRDASGAWHAFFNVCRHHAAAVVDQPQGCASNLRCPYHGWTYGLDGRLKTTPEWEGVEAFDKSRHGLVPARVETWENFVFVCLDPDQTSLAEFLGGMADRTAPLHLGDLRFVERRVYDLNCNWKVFVDNYLDGGYHVPHIHKGLGSVLKYADYRVECQDRFCLQSSPIQSDKGEKETGRVRGGDAAYYFYLYPNFMLNWYEGVADVNVVFPLGPDRARVIFDFYFADAGPAAEEAFRERSVTVAERIQHEDIGVCESVQRGLHSRAYQAGRLSVRREAGEHLFHRLLHADLLQAFEE